MFQIGDRVCWRHERQYVGTVVGVYDFELGVIWDHHSDKTEVRHDTEKHALIYDDYFEIDE